MSAHHPDRTRHWYLAAAAILPALAAVACGSDNGKDSSNNNRDSGLRRPPAPRDLWTVETVASGQVGLHVDLAMSETGPVIAYYSSFSRQGETCFGDTGDNPQMRKVWDLHLAQRSANSWSSELVAEPVYQGSPPGLDLEIAPDGTALIAAMTGEPLDRATNPYCGANDVGLFQQTDSGWTLQTAVSASGEAVSSEPGSNAGDVVGYWPALALDRNAEPAIAYRDVHFGGMQSDDEERADLELATRSGGSWSAVPVDDGRGAGKYNSMLFDGQNRPVIVYFLPETRTQNGEEEGVWVARSGDGGPNWQRARLYPGLTIEKPDIAINDDGRLYVVYYNSDKRLPALTTLVDEEQFESVGEGWVFESPDDNGFGNSRFDEGRHASVAVGPGGLIGVAYYRCVLASGSGQSCSPLDNALVFAWRDPGEGGSWNVETVDEGDESGECGTHASLAFEHDGSAVIAYRCQTVEGDVLDDEVRFARREPL